MFNFGDTMQTVIIHITNERTGRTYEFYDIDSAIEFIDNVTTFDLLVNLGVYRLLITSDTRKRKIGIIETIKFLK